VVAAGEQNDVLKPGLADEFSLVEETQAAAWVLFKQVDEPRQECEAPSPT